MSANGNLSGRSLLAVFAHPDDESIACGGLLARCAELGARVSLICLTHGESRTGVPDQELWRVRAGELDAAARELGVAEVVLLDYPDGFLPWVDATELELRLAAEIRRLHPEVVVTFGHDGLYWHPDHIAVHERTTAAVAALGAAAPALYYVTMPQGLVRAMVDEYLQEPGASGTPPVLGVTDPDAFGVHANAPTLVVDVGAAAVRKLAALKCHKTQITPGGAIARLSEQDAPRLLGIEHFHRASVGASGDAFIERLAR